MSVRADTRQTLLRHPFSELDCFALAAKCPHCGKNNIVYDTALGPNLTSCEHYETSTRDAIYFTGREKRATRGDWWILVATVLFFGLWIARGCAA